MADNKKFEGISWVGFANRMVNDSLDHNDHWLMAKHRGPDEKSRGKMMTTSGAFAVLSVISGFPLVAGAAVTFGVVTPLIYSLRRQSIAKSARTEEIDQRASMRLDAQNYKDGYDVSSEALMLSTAQDIVDHMNDAAKDVETATQNAPWTYATNTLVVSLFSTPLIHEAVVKFSGANSMGGAVAAGLAVVGATFLAYESQKKKVQAFEKEAVKFTKNRKELQELIDYAGEHGLASEEAESETILNPINIDSIEPDNSIKIDSSLTGDDSEEEDETPSPLTPGPPPPEPKVNPLTPGPPPPKP